MPQSKNMARLASDMKRELIAVIGGMKDPSLQNGLLTVMRVEVAPDLSSAKVYVSILEEDRRAPMMAALKKAAGFVRFHLGKRMDLRYTPEVLFTLDTNIEYGVHIASMINQVIQEAVSYTHLYARTSTTNPTRFRWRRRGGFSPITRRATSSKSK